LVVLKHVEEGAGGGEVGGRVGRMCTHP
jgi:hypothetical protein